MEEAHFPLYLSLITVPGPTAWPQQWQRPSLNRRRRRMKNHLGLFINPCLLELFISPLTPQTLPAVDGSVKWQKVRKKNPILLCQCCYHWSFPLYPLAVAVPVPWAGQGWRRGQRGREADWEKVGPLWPQCPTSCSCPSPHQVFHSSLWIWRGWQWGLNHCVKRGFCL